jgi:transposase
MATLSKRMRGKVPYYYLVTSGRVKGKPTLVEQIYLGPLERLADIAKSYNNGIPDPETCEVKELGTVIALYDLAKRLGIAEIIDRHADKREQGLPVSTYIILAAINRVVDSTSKNLFYEWFDNTVLYQVYPESNKKNLSSQAFWNNMEHLSKAKIKLIEDEITKVIVSKYDIATDCLLFDNTNFYTYIDTANPAEIPQRGHCKSKRTDLKIVGLSLMVSPDHNIPLFHETYPGNQNDAKQFAQVLKSLKSRFQNLAGSNSSFTLVFDRGNNSEDNIETLVSDKDNKFHFVGGLRMNQCSDLIEISKIHFHALQGENLEGVTAYRTTKEIYNKDMVVIVTYNPELYDAQIVGVGSNIDKCKHELAEIQSRLAKRARGEITKGKKPTEESVKHVVTKVLSKEHMSKIFDCNIALKDDFVYMDYSLNENAYLKLKDEVLGKSILFSDHFDWETEKIVSAYRAQYHVEACFRQMKDTKCLTFRPVRHFTDDHITVHAFYCVLALMLCSVMNKEFEQLGHKMSINHMVEILNHVRQAKMIFPAAGKKKIEKTSISNLSGAALQYFNEHKILNHLELKKKGIKVV